MGLWCWGTVAAWDGGCESSAGSLQSSVFMVGVLGQNHYPDLWVLGVRGWLDPIEASDSIGSEVSSWLLPVQMVSVGL